MTDLKCPKCGEEEEIYDVFGLNSGYGIKCGNCGYEVRDGCPRAIRTH